MQQNEHDDDIERYLKAFQPRAIRALEMPQPVGSPRLRWLAAAAVVVVSGYIALWYGARQITPKPGQPGAISEGSSSEFRPQTPVNTLALTKLAFEDSKAFDAILTDESRSMFPNMREERSALRVLAKE